MMNLALREVMFPNDAQEFSLLPGCEVWALRLLLCVEQAVMLSHFLVAVSHLKLKLLIDHFELFELENVSSDRLALIDKPGLALGLIVFSQVGHTVLTTDLC